MAFPAELSLAALRRALALDTATERAVPMSAAQRRILALQREMSERPSAAAQVKLRADVKAKLKAEKKAANEKVAAASLAAPAPPGLAAAADEAEVTAAPPPEPELAPEPTPLLGLGGACLGAGVTAALA